MRIKSFILTVLTVFSYFSASASDFFSTEPARQLFTFGARVGINSSNRTFPGKAYDAWNVNSWGTGIDIGAVANIHFREYLSVQPGFFFESRSTNFSYASNYMTNLNTEDVFYQFGHARSYNFTIPVVAQVHFNVTDDLQWLVDFGPYVQFQLHTTDGKSIIVPVRAANNTIYDKYIAKSNPVDFGFKMGTGLMLWNHYSFSIHYLAGAVNAWKQPAGGRNKAWVFTLGYDF